MEPCGVCDAQVANEGEEGGEERERRPDDAEGVSIASRIDCIEIDEGRGGGIGGRHLYRACVIGGKTEWRIRIR